MATTPTYGLPGVRADRDADFRIVCKGDERFTRELAIIDGSESRDPLNTDYLWNLRAGMLMGKITSGGKYAPSVLGVLTAAFDTDASDPTEMTVSAATATEIVRRIGTSGTFNLIGPPAAAGVVATTTVTFSAVDTATGAITVTDPGVDKIAGAFIAPTDGSQTPRGVIGNGHGIRVVDEDFDDIDVPFPNMLIGGYLDSSQIINWPSDTSLQAWVKAALNDADGGGASFVFDDHYTA